jgi:hypothetical protein
MQSLQTARNLKERNDLDETDTPRAVIGPSIWSFTASADEKVPEASAFSSAPNPAALFSPKARDFHEVDSRRSQFDLLWLGSRSLPTAVRGDPQGSQALRDRAL